MPTPEEIARLIEEDFEFSAMGGNTNPLQNPAMGNMPSTVNPSPAIDGRSNRVITQIYSCQAVACIHNADQKCILASIKVNETGGCKSFEVSSQEAESKVGHPEDRLSHFGQDSNTFMTAQYDPEQGMPGE